MGGGTGSPGSPSSLSSVLASPGSSPGSLGGRCSCSCETRSPQARCPQEAAPPPQRCPQNTALLPLGPGSQNHNSGAGGPEGACWERRWKGWHQCPGLLRTGCLFPWPPDCSFPSVQLLGFLQEVWGLGKTAKVAQPFFHVFLRPPFSTFGCLGLSRRAPE